MTHDSGTGDTIVNVYSMAFTKQLAGEKGYGSIVNGEVVARMPSLSTMR